LITFYPLCWQWRRFSDFEAVQKKLKALKCRVPALPSKNPFGFQDANFLQVRGHTEPF
jgi:hypothetical protein